MYVSELSTERMTGESTYKEMVSRLKEEYRRMLNRWDNGEVFYHFKAFIKRYARVGWVRYDLVKEPLCAVLALSRHGLPITTPSVAFLLGYESKRSPYRVESAAYQRLMYLASYNVLEPTGTLKSGSGTSTRGFRLTPIFIESGYKSLKELEGGKSGRGG